MEARQERIADLARTVLPFMEAHEHKNTFFKVVHQVLIVALTAVLGYSAALHLRPITYAEEKTLKVLLEYSAQQKPGPVTDAKQRLLNHFHVKRLADIRAYQWNEAVSRLTTESE